MSRTVVLRVEKKMGRTCYAPAGKWLVTSCFAAISCRSPLRACPCQKLSWPAGGEVSFTASQLGAGSNPKHRLLPTKKPSFVSPASTRLIDSLCNLTRAGGRLFRSGRFARVKMMQAANVWNLDHRTKQRRLDRSAHGCILSERCVRHLSYYAK